MKIPLNKLNYLNKGLQDIIISSWDDLSPFAKKTIFSILIKKDSYEELAIKECVSGNYDFENKIKTKINSNKLKIIKKIEANGKDNNLDILINNI